METVRCDAASEFHGAPYAAPGLADVVRRPRRTERQPVALFIHAASGRRLAGCAESAGRQSLPRSSAAVRAGGDVRLSIHQSFRARGHRRLVATKRTEILRRNLAARAVTTSRCINHIISRRRAEAQRIL